MNELIRVGDRHDGGLELLPWPIYVVTVDGIIQGKTDDAQVSDPKRGLPGDSGEFDDRDAAIARAKTISERQQSASDSVGVFCARRVRRGRIFGGMLVKVTHVWFKVPF